MNQAISEIINRKPRFICIEDLNVSGMMKNRHLSKAVQEQGFFWFRKQLEYKCSDKGIQLIVADRFYPSSKLCSCCGNIKKDLKLTDRIYRCECGNMIDRDFPGICKSQGLWRKICKLTLRGSCKYVRIR
ncbi:MAG: RNA-guided endonuclease TnpB family protein [Blautia sp.]